jgi:hypothetical protein
MPEKSFRSRDVPDKARFNSASSVAVCGPSIAPRKVFPFTGLSGLFRFCKPVVICSSRPFDLSQEIGPREHSKKNNSKRSSLERLGTVYREKVAVLLSFVKVL